MRPYVSVIPLCFGCVIRLSVCSVIAVVNDSTHGDRRRDAIVINSKGNYTATPNNTKLIHWPLMGWVGCYIWYSEERPGRAAAPPSPLLAVPNVTAHPSTASVPITVLLYNDPLLCGFNVAIKGLSVRLQMRGLSDGSVHLFVCMFVRSFVRYSIAF